MVTARRARNRALPPARGTRDRVWCIYIVEDDLPTLQLLTEVAEEAGWEARGFTRLAPARAAIDQRPPAMLFMDDELPDGRGGDIARQITEAGNPHGIKLVVCTAAHRGRRTEISAWARVVLKPFDLSHIERLMMRGWREPNGAVGHAG